MNQGNQKTSNDKQAVERKTLFFAHLSARGPQVVTRAKSVKYAEKPKMSGSHPCPCKGC